jgi:D-aminopeptidase
VKITQRFPVLLFPTLLFLIAEVLLGFAALAAAPAQSSSNAQHEEPRPRARDMGLAPGVLAPGRLNAITDVEGVLVGQVTLPEGATVRTGVTIVMPHPGNIYQDKVPAGIAVGNGFGKFAGSTQIEELGEIETPIALTNTLAVPAVAQGLIEWTLHQTGNEAVTSVNPVVGETNDSWLNDIRTLSVRPSHVLQAISLAAPGQVAEGSVGAGTGTRAFYWKGGIGTSSRVLPKGLCGCTVGVLVQTNYGGVLTMMGAPVGLEFGRYYLKDELAKGAADGSVIIVVATDAPLSDRNLKRLARRALLGIARTGSPMTNGSGDYAVAFSTAISVRRTADRRRVTSLVEDLPNDALSPLFQAAVEATEESVYNAILRATTVHGVNTLDAIPLEELRVILRKHGINATSSASAGSKVSDP